MLIHIKEAPFIYWNQSRGQRLKATLGKTSNYEVAEKMQELGHDCSRQNVDKIVNGNSRSVSVSLLLSICETFGIDIMEIVPLRVETKAKETNENLVIED